MDPSDSKRMEEIDAGCPWHKRVKYRSCFVRVDAQKHELETARIKTKIKRILRSI